MTARERKWIKRRLEERSRRRFYREAKRQMFNSLFDCNMMGSKVFLNDKGYVEVKILTVEECLDLKARIDAGEATPEDTTFQYDIL